MGSSELVNVVSVTLDTQGLINDRPGTTFYKRLDSEKVTIK